MSDPNYINAGPETIIRTLVERQAFDFAVLLNQLPQLATDEIARQYISEKRSTLRHAQLFYFVSLGLGLLAVGLIDFDSHEVSVFGLGVTQLVFSPAIPIFLMGVSFSTYVIHLVSGMVLNSYVREIYSRIAGYPTGTLEARWDGSTAWVDLLRIRVVGYKSGLAHIVVSTATFLTIFLLTLSIIIFCNVVAWLAAVDEFSEHIFTTFLSITGAFIVTFATFFLIVSTIVPFKFRFEQGEMSEVSGEFRDQNK